MSRLDMLKAQAAKQREERERVYLSSVTAAVNSAMSSPIVALTVMQQLGKDGASDVEATERVVNAIAKKVTEKVTDYVSTFVSVCRQRGMHDRRIHSAVDQIYIMYFSEFRSDDTTSPIDVSYAEKLDAVALKFEMEPMLWNTIALVQSTSSL